jgi:hypothetical protein
MGLTRFNLDVEFCLTVQEAALKISALHEAMAHVREDAIPRKAGWVLAALQDAIDRQYGDIRRAVEREEARKNQKTETS